MNDPLVQIGQSLIDSLVAQDGGGAERVISAIVIAVTIDEEGSKCLRMFASDDLTSWERRGILAEILDDFSAQNVNYWAGFEE